MSTKIDLKMLTSFTFTYHLLVDATKDTAGNSLCTNVSHLELLYEKHADVRTFVIAHFCVLNTHKKTISGARSSPVNSKIEYRET